MYFKYKFIFDYLHARLIMKSLGRVKNSLAGGLFKNILGLILSLQRIIGYNFFQQKASSEHLLSRYC